MRVTVWNEFVHEQTDAAVQAVYPDGIHECLRHFLEEAGFAVRTATLAMPEHGLTQDVLENTDVLVWWGHLRHADVTDEVTARVVERVLSGMGLVVLHSAHMSKPFMRLMGTSCNLKWRESDQGERVWVVDPSHPVASGIGEYIELRETEMYGEHCDVPAPDELVFVSWHEGGEVFRSGSCWKRGCGRIFYFSPGHETYPIYRNADIQRVICNAVRYCAPVGSAPPVRGHVEQPMAFAPLPE